ncbi:hypothetical protein BU23DRAFT_560033 [Bimuria novae-zelandiae CBS 107.79]|uniref:Uncharacterized protein n=1 Tax=Bimuria novae-zelandiae CBS 107.79 TaxID=1447943 RepID=A0A6A5UPI8_9PLEO|nr:hypothetical protein BU23DRAFT_560033 [Bimuria novae-zelandiae CBS 107.79]
MLHIQTSTIHAEPYHLHPLLSYPNPRSLPQHLHQALFHQHSPSIWTQIRTSHRRTRYIIYTGIFLAATAETAFWANVVWAKYFARASDRSRADAFLSRCRDAVTEYRARWLKNYTLYWARNLWGL